MRRWLPKIPWHRREIADAIAIAALGVVLCALLIVFVNYRLNEANWLPEGLTFSDDGQLCATISRAGMRVHNVASGREVDRYAFSEPWRALKGDSLFYHGELHPYDYLSTNWKTPKAIKISPSGRYVAIFAPTGYLMLWDRQTGRFQKTAESQFEFSAFSFDEERNQLFVEATYQSLGTPSGSVPLSLEPDFDAPEEIDEEVYPIDLLTYRLDELARIQHRRVEHAGVRLGDLRDVRMIRDDRQDELRIMQCDDFPEGSQKVIHRVPLAKLVSYARGAYCSGSPRWSEGKFYFANRSASAIAMHSDFTPEAQPRKFRLPPEISGCEFSWIGDGCASLHKVDGEQLKLATWDRDLSIALFEVPDDTFETAAIVKDKAGEKRVRAASASGLVIDLPVGKKGEIGFQQLEMAGHPRILMTVVVSALASIAIWAIWAAATKSLLSNRGWVVLLLACLWVGLVFSLDLEFARQNYSKLSLIGCWLAMLAIVLIAVGLCLSRNGRVRSAVVLTCAIAMLLVTVHALGRNRDAEIQRQMAQFRMF